MTLWIIKGMNGEGTTMSVLASQLQLVVCSHRVKLSRCKHDEGGSVGDTMVHKEKERRVHITRKQASQSTIIHRSTIDPIELHFAH